MHAIVILIQHLEIRLQTQPELVGHLTEVR